MAGMAAVEIATLILANGANVNMGDKYGAAPPQKKEKKEFVHVHVHVHCICMFN